MNTFVSLQKSKHVFLPLLPAILVAVTTLIGFGIGTFSLMSGWTTIFQNLLYIPIIIACVYYTRRGFICSVAIAGGYFVLMALFTQDSASLKSALIRVLIFILVAAVITYLSEARMRTEATLRESEEKYRSLFENAVAGFFQTTPDGRFLSANPFLAKLLGFSSPQELIETLTNIGEQHYANPQDRVTFKNILESQGKISQYETKLLKKDGTVIWASINARVVRDEKGSILYYEGTLEDITERKRAENALQVNEENYRLLASYHKQLNDISIVLAEALGTEYLFKRIAESLRLLTGAIAATFSVYNQNTRTLKVVSLSIDPRASSKAGSIFGPELFEMHMPVSEDVMEHMLSQSIARPKDLCELTFGVMPKEVSDAVMEAVGCRQIVALAVTHMDKLIGTCVAYLPEDQPIVPDDALKTFTHLTGLAIKRKQAEEAYKESEGKLNAIMQSIPDHMSVIDKELNIIWANETAIRLFGSDIIGRKCYEAYHKRKEPCEPYPCLTLKAFKDGGVHEHNTEVVDTVGKTIYFHCTANVALRDKDDKPIAVLETSRDITERKHAEEDLNKSFDKYKELSIMLESLFNAIPDILGIQDAQHGVIRYNQAGYDFLGCTQQEVEGKKCFELIKRTKPCDICATSEVYITKKMAQVEKYLEEIGVWLECRSYPVFGEDGKITRIIEHLRDITERKLAETEKESLQAQLLQAQKIESVGRLAGGVAHDFNNMLSVILGYAQLAMMDIPQAEPIYAYLKGIQDSAVRSADLTRQLLAFARKQTIAPIVLELNDTINGMIKMLRRLIGEDISLVWMPGAGLWQVKIDPSQIDQLLANLCVNARDSISGVGKVTIETENTAFDEAYCSVHKGFTPGEYVMLAVSDDGHGMNKDVRSHLFEPFFTTKELGKGTGLGLSTVYGIVKQNKGFINVYSEPGNGSTFKIYLPKLEGEAIQLKTESQTEMPKGRGETILLVEDEASLLNIVRIMLEQLDYKVLTAGTPGEALRQAKDYTAEIQLLITDVIMPEMNGKELAKLISNIKPNLKCLFASGYTANVIAHHGVLDEGVNFIQKPFSLQTLAAKVREVLERESKCIPPSLTEE